MRSVNLIPPDARRGDGTKMRTGGVPYVLLGGLCLLLLGVIAVAFTSKQISDKKTDVTNLNQKLEATTAKAQSLSAFAQFGAIEQTRNGTITSLAQSRFDWERVLNELAIVIPDDVWLVQLAGTVSPDVQIEEGPDVQVRDSITGPALEIVGCAVSQDATAAFVADLEDIDGVTRVGVASSERPEEAASADSTEVTSDSDSTTEECRTQDFIARFEIVVAFDEVPVPAAATTTPGVPAPLTNGFGDVAQQQAQQAANSAEVAQGSAQAAQAANVLPGG
jgi:Tfp pilus assembly protein PilN